MTKSRETGEVLNTRGTAATKDTGTGAGDVPTNADLPDLGPLITGGAYMTVGGTANAITLTSPAGYTLTSLVAGMQFRFKTTTQNTGAITISVDGIAAVAGKTVTGVACPADYIRNDIETVITYDGTDFVVYREVERGSNGDGRYSLFADGLLLQSGTSTATTSNSASNTFGTSSGTTYFGDAVVTFPKVYDSLPVTNTGTTQPSTSIAVVERVSTTTGYSPRIWAQDNGTIYPIGWSATGYWY